MDRVVLYLTPIGANLDEIISTSNSVGGWPLVVFVCFLIALVGFTLTNLVIKLLWNLPTWFLAFRRHSLRSRRPLWDEIAEAEAEDATRRLSLDAAARFRSQRGIR